jgi:hypothetical protein
MIELRLSSLPNVGTVAQVFEAAVRGYFTTSPDKFAAFYQAFNVFESSEDHLRDMMALVKNIRRYVLQLDVLGSY